MMTTLPNVKQLRQIGSLSLALTTFGFGCASPQNVAPDGKGGITVSGRVVGAVELTTTYGENGKKTEEKLSFVPKGNLPPVNHKNSSITISTESESLVDARNTAVKGGDKSYTPGRGGTN